ncbi:hypothetical protein RZS08_56595, partial [Arthrospira platensis SPKY1]|nr:hypothetical protein [Arthrospira platensis SPKY1]
RQKSDWLMMALAFGKENISVNVFYGSDFFLDTETELLERLKLTPNPIERKNILIRLNHIRNRFNTSKKDRIDLLYAIMPFTTDDEFKLAMESDLIDDQTKLLQLQFNYWVTLFESNYGDI